MTIRWSKLHALLGVGPGPVTYDLISSAIAARLAEEDDLDWKAILPGKEEAQLEEYAKDVAAMANSIGGLIVFGVEEQRGTGQASAVQTVDVTEGAQRRLRALAATRIHPTVAGLDLIPLTSDDGATSVLVLVVLRSPDAPHMIGQGARIGVPYRSGPETVWMRERDIERAYADRFRRRDDEHIRLNSMRDDISDQLDFDKGAWLIAIARPRSPLPGIAGELTRANATSVLASALSITAEMIPAGPTDRYTPLRELGDAALNPRVGLRRWIAQTTSGYSPDDRCSFVHIQLHHDGSIGFAIALEGWFRPIVEGKHEVVCPLVESACLDFIATVEAYCRFRGETVPASYQIDLVSQDDADFVAVDLERYGAANTGKYAVVQGSRALRRLTAVSGEVPVAFDIDTLRSAARTAALDVLRQFGVPQTSVIK